MFGTLRFALIILAGIISCRIPYILDKVECVVGSESRTPTESVEPLKSDSSTTEAGSDQTDRIITLEELEKHNTEDDCWIGLEGVVYDVSGYAENHPGGKQEMLRKAGTNVTGFFGSMHQGKEFDEEIKKVKKIGVLDLPAETDKKKWYSSLCCC
ncbi:Cytochrome b5-like Heme/Steroid binding domain containing protein [Theileria equi strain WA]|uniref:Cytochrome b5-like Heme/Steroid binding domain containing protein n=1 Tax=Theileria equi strain WA TaxID=1537102 RepID=L0ATE5_THEEQ|nr:Cytochrome b5-like Heme/Steroid binding domain containing protein [Theileria equi strain WA]AFZ78907.1 Cytochrome b5-like Heme/Steroid binding domain containing protein [Theileria equi strain WA]|eukprot:XP_004828573.1 Cytochrome b5-like Heme/Steroid binding domain containing protein [Theileria equi strain WA]